MRTHTFIFLMLSFFAVPLYSAILIKEIPQEMLSPSEESDDSFEWIGFSSLLGIPSDAPSQCLMVCSRSPGFVPADYTLAAIDQSTRSFDWSIGFWTGYIDDFNPEDNGLGAGRYFARIVDAADPLNFSEEFFFIVEAGQAPALSLPENG